MIIMMDHGVQYGKKSNEDMQNVRYKKMSRVNRSEVPVSWRNCRRERGLGSCQWESGFLNLTLCGQCLLDEYWSQMCSVCVCCIFLCDLKINCRQ